jgi:hypothetical protein
VKKPKRLSFRVGEMMTNPKLLGPFFAGPSWDLWCTVLRATFGEPLDDAETATFREVAGGRDPPKHRVRQAVYIAGRSAGKDSVASLIVTTIAVNFDPRVSRLRPGEQATVLCVACDRDQAALVLRYIRGYFEQVPASAAASRFATASR